MRPENWEMIQRNYESVIKKTVVDFPGGPMLSHHLPNEGDVGSILMGS